MYQEGRQPVYLRIAVILFLGLFFSALILLAGAAALGESQGNLGLLFLGGCTLLVGMALWPLMLVLFWRDWHSPVLLLTTTVRQKKLVTAHGGIGRPQHWLMTRPLEAVQLGSDGRETPISAAKLPTDYLVQPQLYTAVQEGDRVLLLCNPRLKLGVRLITHWPNEPAADEPDSQEPQKIKKAEAPPAAADLVREYRQYVQGRLLLILIIGLGLSSLAFCLGLGGLFLSNEADLFATFMAFACFISLGGVGLVVTGVYGWRIWQARPQQITAVVVSRWEEQRRSRGVTVLRFYHLRLRLLRMSTFPLNPGEQPTELPLPQAETEVDYNVPAQLFEQVQEKEQIECLVIPSLKRVIARLD